MDIQNNIKFLNSLKYEKQDFKEENIYLKIQFKYETLMALFQFNFYVINFIQTIIIKIHLIIVVTSKRHMIVEKKINIEKIVSSVRNVMILY